MKLYSISTGQGNPLKKKSRQAMEYLGKQEGFVAVHILNQGILWLYDSLNHAKAARNKGRSKGIQFGTYICEFECSQDMQMITATGEHW